MSNILDFTRPWARGMKVIPRKGDEPPRLERATKEVPFVDEDGNKVKAKVVHGTPGRVDPWVKPNGKDNG